MGQRSNLVELKDVFFMLTLCELLGKPVRMKDVEQAYEKVTKQAQRDGLKKYAQNPDE
jgi:hypothetical protein